jgi:hypothetical protein
MSEANKPAAKVQLYPATATIWRNQSPKGVAYSVTFERSYKDEQGNYKSSTSFNTSELLLVSKIADLAHTEIYRLRAEDRNTEKSEDEAA